MPLRILLLALCSAFLLAACDGGQAPQPTDGETGEAAVPPMPTGQLGNAVVPTHYDLDLTILPSRETFSGTVAIDVEINEPAPVIWLHGNRLDVSKVSLTTPDGTEINAAYEQAHETGVAKVSLESTPPTGPATLHFVYTAPFNQSLEGLYAVEDAGEAYAFTQFEATSARLAFPGFDEPAFKVPFDIAVTTREGNAVITATPEAMQEPAGEDLVRRVFETTKPLPTYLIAFAVGPLDVVEWEPLPPTDVRDRQIPLYGVATRGKGDQLTYALENTHGILESLESYFGRPYPYRKLAIIAVPDFAAGAMENVGAITYREQLLLLGDGSQVSPGRKRAYARVHAHELAHQWFGNLVTPKWWDDIWLNESFATWMGNKAIDAWQPGEGYGNLTLRGALGVMGSDALASARQIREPIRSNHDIATAFDGITYQKGGGVLEMFEAWLGEDAFRNGVRLFMERFAFEVADVNDFLQALADGANRPEVIEAFRSFLFQPGVPLVTVDVDCSGEAPQATLMQGRYLPLGSEADPDQIWQVPVCMAFDADDGRGRFCTLADMTQVAAPLPTEQCPAWVMPNGDGSGYYRFALDSEGWSNLIENVEALNARERLAMMGSLSAAFRSDDADTATLASAFEIFAQGEDREVAMQPLGDLRTMHDRLAATEAARAGIEAFVRDLYAQRLEAIGLEPTADDSTDTRLLRGDLVAALAEMGRYQALRNRLTEMAEAYLGDDELQPEAVPESLVGIALRVAVAEKDTAFAESLLERALASRDGTFRQRALSALAGAPQAEIGEMVRGLITDERLRDNEAIMIVFGQVGTPEQREPLWTWVQSYLEDLLGRIPTWRQGAVVNVGAGFCSTERAAELEAFFADKVANLEGGPRELAQTLERIRLCAALKDAKAEEVTDYFGDSA